MTGRVSTVINGPANAGRCGASGGFILMMTAMSTSPPKMAIGASFLRLIFIRIPLFGRKFAAKGKEIWANVEFYKGAVFHSLGIPTHYFTAMFAMARVYGYIAHFLEFRQDSRLIRPRARYTGHPVGTRSKSAA